MRDSIRIALLLFAGALFLAHPSLVVADTTLDVSASGSQTTGTAQVGGTFVVQGALPQSTGTGVLQPFLRIQNTPNEQGYNTDANNPPFDDKGGPWTHSLLLSSLAPITLTGFGTTTFFEFTLDSNQIGNGLITVNQIQIFQAASDPGATAPAVTGTDPPVLGTFSGAFLAFQMSADGAVAGNHDSEIIVHGGSGSGSGDMFLYVPTADFSATNKPYVVLYAQLGNPPGTNESNDGFEEWSALQGTFVPPVPDGGMTLMLLGGALVCMESLRRRFRA